MAHPVPPVRLAHPLRSARLRSRLPEILGWLALFSALALASPGVVAVARAEPAGASAESGQLCQASQARGEQRIRHLEQYIEALRQQAAAQRGAEGDDFVALDNSGFNYRASPPVSPAPADR